MTCTRMVRNMPAAAATSLAQRDFHTVLATFEAVGGAVACRMLPRHMATRVFDLASAYLTPKRRSCKYVGFIVLRGVACSLIRSCKYLGVS